MITLLTEKIHAHLSRGKRVWLFLDYDGTLADFAPTPEEVIPDPELIALLKRLSALPHLRLTIISGRRLAHVKTLVPLPEAIRAGTYGIEIYMPESGEFDRLEFGTIRPTLEKIKPRWEALIADREGFFLEDKGWAVALHAKYADDDEAQSILSEAEDILHSGFNLDPFRILGGDKFLEIGPKTAHKGETVDYLIERFQEPEMLLVYVGDDDKDEEAFGVIQSHNGIAVVVAGENRPTKADFRLESPQAVRSWLAELLNGSLN